MSRNVISTVLYYQVCDGVTDCPDSSDECGVGCNQTTFLSTEFYIFGSERVETLIIIAGALSIIINILTFFYLTYQHSSDYFKYPTKTINLLLLRGGMLVSVCVGSYVFLFSWRVRANHKNTLPHYCYSRDAWTRSDTCSHLGILSTGALLSVVTLSALSNLASSRYKLTRSIPPLEPVPRNTVCSPANTAVILVILIYFLSFTYAYLPHSRMVHDLFAEEVRYDLFPLSNGSRAHVQELVSEYYGGNKEPRTWTQINKLVGEMFTGLHREVSVTYNTLYGSTDICILPLLVEELTSPRSIYQLLTLGYLSLLQLLNILLVLLNKIYPLTVKTDFPHDLVQLSTCLCVLTTTPLLVASIAHNAGVISIAYYYSALALCSLVALALSNLVLLSYMVYKRCWKLRYRVRRYPSVSDCVGYGVGHSVGQYKGFGDPFKRTRLSQESSDCFPNSSVSSGFSNNLL